VIFMIKRIPSRSPYGLYFKLKMALWWFVESVFFRTSLHKMNGFRCFILRLFGAKIGINTFIHPSARIWFPWNFQIGDNGGVGFDSLIYSLDLVILGDFVTVSQRVHINTGSHDYTRPDFSLITKPVKIEDGVFIGTDSYINMGVVVGAYSVIGARSVVVKDLPSGYLCVGHPCVPIKLISS